MAIRKASLLVVLLKGAQVEPHHHAVQEKAEGLRRRDGADAGGQQIVWLGVIGQKSHG
jgi:hypothetical protein